MGLFNTFFGSKILTIFLFLTIVGVVFYFFGGVTFITEFANNSHNRMRINKVDSVSDKIVNLISKENTLPTTNVPEEGSILTSLTFRDNNPLGGVNIHTLDGKFKGVASESDQIYIGYFGKYLIVYAGDLNITSTQNQTSYYKVIEVNQDELGKLSPKIKEEI